MDTSPQPDQAAWPPPPRATGPDPRARDVPAPGRAPVLSAAGWLAAAGASRLRGASIVVVAGNWQSIDVEVRFSGLVAALVGIYFGAEAGRRRSPLTATALAVLAATLTAPVGVAAAATIRQPWPVCVLVGGLAALLATEIQSRRWRVPILQAATVVAFGLAAVGAAALTGVPVTVIGALGAATALAAGAQRRGAVLGLAVGATPVLVVLSDAGVGPGTLARLGVTGPTNAWATSFACTIGAVVVGVVAHRRSNAPLAIAAVAVFGSGVASAVVGGDVAPALGWTLPAIALLVVELVGAARSDSIWRDLARRASGGLTAAIAVVGLAAPYRSILARSANGRAWEAGGWWIPLVLTALALLAAAIGSRRRADNDDATAAVVLAACASIVAAVAATGLPLWTAAVAALGCWVAMSCTMPWRSWDITTAVVASWVLFAEITDGGPAWLRVALVTLGGVALVVSVSSVERRDHGWRLVGAAAVIGLGCAVVSGGEPVAVGITAYLGLTALGVGLRPRDSTGPLAVAGFVTFRLTSDATIGWIDAVATGVLAAAFAMSSRSATSVRTHVAAGLAVAGAAFALVPLGLDAATATLTTAFLAVALTGVSLVDRRFVAARTAGLLASSIALVVSVGADPAFTSLAVILFGVQAGIAGVTWRGPVEGVAGWVISAAGIISLWWTTGTNAWAVDAIAPYGATGTDLAVAAAVTILLGLGFVGRRTATTLRPISSWLAYGPGLAMAATWLLSSQLDPDAEWATMAALVVGIAS
ncbi:MAG: hypothetical protein ABWZ42_01195, partial [Ilumatobacteraceae bacterium]